jgi:hypothetical protein
MSSGSGIAVQSPVQAVGKDAQALTLTSDGNDLCSAVSVLFILKKKRLKRGCAVPDGYSISTKSVER